MKFFAPLIVAGSVHGRVDVNENNFVLIPDGYRGFFQDLNVTQLIQENRDDEMFYEFEEKFQKMHSDPDTTMDQFKTMNKIKMVKNLILYLQDVPMFGKYFNYGCHCFRNEGQNFLKDMTIGKPQDRPDKVCRDHSRCHACIKMDYKSFCDVHRGYEFEARVDSVTNTKYIQCTDSFDTCHRSLCECDKALAYDLADSEGIWSLVHHTDWGAFKADQHCDIYNDGDRPHIHLKSAVMDVKLNEPILQCCGEYPRRYPYHSDDGFGGERKCCNGVVFDPNSHECCEDDAVRELGMCFGVSLGRQWGK